MDEAEKLTALKKAYADIILNTAKEAAARIMVSERKAIRFQQELFAAKEEALQMLIRLKQMMDSKITEAEKTSLIQQRRIDELEAQLQEAEDIVRDLRAELRDVQDELEKVATYQSPVDEPNIKGGSNIQEEISQENRHQTSDSIMCPPIISQSGPVTSPVKDSVLKNQGNEGNKCQRTNESYMENHYASNPDFASMIMITKEPELYRNGCTQRIRAFERNSLEGSLPLSDEINGIKNEVIREDDEGDVMHLRPVVDTDTCCSLEKKPNKVKEVMQADSGCCKVQVIKSFRRKRKRAARYKKSRIPSSRRFLNRVMERCQASDFSSPRTSAYSFNSNVQSGKDPNNLNETEPPKDSESPLASRYPSHTPELISLSGCVEGIKGTLEFVKSCSTHNSTDNDDAVIDNMELARPESGSGHASGSLACKMDSDSLILPSNSDPKTFNATTDGVPAQPATDRLIKYTFRRKRKKESMSSTDCSASTEKSFKRKMEEKQNDPSSEPQKSSTIIESSRDSRRLAQVARQLISLSEKKWWH